MRRSIVVGVVVAAVAACQGGAEDAPARRMSTETPPPAAMADAGAPAPLPTPAARTGEPAAPAAAEAEEGWLDPVPGEVGPGARTARTARSPARPRRFVQLILRSTPPEATVYVDGERVGITPTFWEAEVESRSYDFTFTKRGHVTHFYRFVPITSGVVHPKLDKLTAAPPPDAGMPDPSPR